MKSNEISMLNVLQIFNVFTAMKKHKENYLSNFP